MTNETKINEGIVIRIERSISNKYFTLTNPRNNRYIDSLTEEELLQAIEENRLRDLNGC